MKNIKKILSLLVILTLVLSLGACSRQEKAEEATEEATEESAEESGAEIANPWTDVDSYEAAAEGAGLDTFGIADGVSLSLGELAPTAYRYMEGMAEAIIPVAAVELTVRKGTGEEDISGDFNSYAHEWSENISGMDITCYGNKEGAATKTIWSLGGYSYAILAYGQGGDTDFGLDSADLNTLINAIE